MRLIDADILHELIDGGFDLDFDEVPETKRELLRMVDEQETIVEFDGEINEVIVKGEKYYKPTIDAVPVKHGKWVDHQYKEFPIGRYECSVCGKRHDMEWDYCPNCGTKMDGGKDDE